jgi:hypothetical protein
MNVQNCDVRIDITISQAGCTFLTSIIESEMEEVVVVNFQHLFYFLCRFIKKCKHGAVK